MRRRHLLALLGAGLAPAAAAAAATAAEGPLRLGAAWRGPAEGDAHHVGVIEADWATRRLRIAGSAVLPSRPHGLLAEPGGGLLAVALRPGRWLLRLDAAGRTVQRLDIADEPQPRRFAGHVVASADGRTLYTTESDPDSGAGRVGVRDARTLQKLDDWPSHGLEPHQLLLDASGHLLVANGGIPRAPDDRKLDLARMDSSLVRLHGARGTPLGQWRLADSRLSQRHLAWSADGTLGVALQAEHDDAAARRDAPALALWDGEALRPVAGGEGYAGDIAGVPGGGLVISDATRDRALWWHPSAPQPLVPVAQLKRAYALAGADAVYIAAGLGLARWHPREAPAMLAWPQPMALDNHMVVLSAPA